ncbi:DUF5988 family protein [Actinoplanes sp. NPDC048796]|uniref:DUF5988 family protein n=1 Tax=unclassified Actinoplanes TaxID=2626549 RepID=UPI0033DBAF70
MTQLHVSSPDEAVTATLEGGPVDIPADQRRITVAAADRKVKVPYYGGYEHFERADEASAGSPLVFRWTMRTTIAE